MGTITLKNVHKRFGDVTIIPNANLEIGMASLSYSSAHRAAENQRCCG